MTSINSRPSVLPRPPPPTLLTLPLEIRRLIYSHALVPIIILPNILRLSASPSQHKTQLSNSFEHPSPLNPLTYGIASSLHSRWRVPTQAYPSASRVRVVSVPYVFSPLPHPLQLTCKQLCSEVTEYALTSGTWTFAFSSFQALIKWLKGRDGRRQSMEEFLQLVGSVLIEMDLRVIPSSKRDAGPPAAGGSQGPDFSSDYIEDTLGESELPWLDAFRLLTRLCPSIRTLGLTISLSGPEIQVINFGSLPRAPTAPNAFPQNFLLELDQPPTVGPIVRTDWPPRDWPPGQLQTRADFAPTLRKILGFVESFQGLRRCGISVTAGHMLKNVAADPGDGSLWVRTWLDSELDSELEQRIRRLERGLNEAADDELTMAARRPGLALRVIANVAESRKQILAAKGRDQYWY